VGIRSMGPCSTSNSHGIATGPCLRRVRFTPDSRHCSARLARQKNCPTPDITPSPEQVQPAKNRDGKCHRRRVVVRDASRRWGVNQTVLPPSDESCKSRAQARRKPEKPELADICTSSEQRGASTTRRIDRRVCDRNQKQVDQS